MKGSSVDGEQKKEMADGGRCGLLKDNGEFWRIVSGFASNSTRLAGPGRARVKHGEPLPCRRCAVEEKKGEGGGMAGPGDGMGGK